MHILNQWQKLDDELVTQFKVEDEELPTKQSAADEAYASLLLKEQPKDITKKFTLKHYQLVGVSWLSLLQRRGLGGILADEMGLGKTAQVISFLTHLRDRGVRGPHLIIVPSSTLENWLREFEVWSPTMRVQPYYGNQKERIDSQYDLMRGIQRGRIDAIVTTYNLATGAKADRNFLRKIGPQTLILDEGHMVKNMMSARYGHLMAIESPFRLLLTGTPIQNDLMELLSLLSFIMPKIFEGRVASFGKLFKARVGVNSSDANYLSESRIVRAQRMMAPFVLRRRKRDVLKDLPKKYEKIIFCEPTTSQREISKKLIQASKAQYLQELREQKATGKKIVRVLKKTDSSWELNESAGSNLLMQLRKVADHPLLFRRLYTDALIKRMAREIMRETQYIDANIAYIQEDMSYMSDYELHLLCMKFPSIRQHALPSDAWMDAGKVQRLASLLTELKAGQHRVLIFSQFVMVLDILESVLRTEKHLFVRMDGSTPVVERQSMIDRFNNEPDLFVFLLSTKAGGFGINLTSSDTVILFDLDFNPHNDKQAEDRAHRVGQTRDVTIYKMILRKSIEQHILKVTTDKLQLDHEVQKGTKELMSKATAAATGAASTAGSADADADAATPVARRASETPPPAGAAGATEGGDVPAATDTVARKNDAKVLQLLRKKWVEDAEDDDDDEHLMDTDLEAMDDD
ncbi:hypothetical protein CXG81DRAFT_14009 [Caulochytrium protostelioides]|uniref:Uncharacterized protein n=1 Tax=Caulochytrium protostelioides TaxID=1555241 RepID=A0A4P9X419_9FUNG|nr:hypothetical protein CXG81DRAFT_14009 [Caulochytrium protostelioides]|eukprot:RKO99806.1 hypothetical protein CXG81DRAFT_14009 [Caulochytrium protostelioides]